MAVLWIFYKSIDLMYLYKLLTKFLAIFRKEIVLL